MATAASQARQLALHLPQTSVRRTHTETSVNSVAERFDSFVSLLTYVVCLFLFLNPCPSDRNQRHCITSGRCCFPAHLFSPLCVLWCLCESRLQKMYFCCQKKYFHFETGDCLLWKVWDVEPYSSGWLAAHSVGMWRAWNDTILHVRSSTEEPDKAPPSCQSQGFPALTVCTSVQFYALAWFCSWAAVITFCLLIPGKDSQRPDWSLQVRYSFTFTLALAN